MTVIRVDPLLSQLVNVSASGLKWDCIQLVGDEVLEMTIGSGWVVKAGGSDIWPF